MCFRYLPIEFTSDGKARLKEGLDDPWGVRRNAERRRRRELEVPAARREGQRAVMRSVGLHAFGVVINRGRSAMKPQRSPRDVL